MLVENRAAVAVPAAAEAEVAGDRPGEGAQGLARLPLLAVHFYRQRPTRQSISSTVSPTISPCRAVRDELLFRLQLASAIDPRPIVGGRRGDYRDAVIWIDPDKAAALRPDGQDDAVGASSGRTTPQVAAGPRSARPPSARAPPLQQLNIQTEGLLTDAAGVRRRIRRQARTRRDPLHPHLGRMAARWKSWARLGHTTDAYLRSSASRTGTIANAPCRGSWVDQRAAAARRPTIRLATADEVQAAMKHLGADASRLGLGSADRRSTNPTEYVAASITEASRRRSASTIIAGG